MQDNTISVISLFSEKSYDRTDLLTICDKLEEEPFGTL